MNQRRAGVVISFGGMAIGAVVNLAVTPLVLRVLGDSEFGIYSLSASIVSFMSLFGFGFSAAYLRFYWTEKRSGGESAIARINGSFLLLYLGSAVVAAGAGVLLIENLSLLLGPKVSADEAELTRRLCSLMLISVITAFPFSLFDSYILVHERFVFQRSMTVIRQAVGPLLFVPVLLAGFRSTGLVVVTVSVYLLTGFWAMWFSLSRLGMKFRFKGLRMETFAAIGVFSSYLFVNMLVDQINWNADKLILGRFRGSEAVAIYSLGALLNQMYMMLATTIASVLVPAINEAATGGRSTQRLNELFVKSGRIQFAVLSLVLVGFVVLGSDFVRMWAGAGYGETWTVTLLLIVPATIPFVQNIGIEIQKARNLHQFRSKMLAAGALVNVGISILVAESLGPTGVAGVTGASLLVFNGLMMNWHYSRHLEIDIWAFWKSILGLSKAPIAGAAAGVLMYLGVGASSVGGFLACGVTIVVVHVLVLWLYCFDESERAMVSRPLSGFGS